MTTAAPQQQQENVLESIRQKIAAVPNFPKPGILFRDISPLLADPLREKAYDLLADSLKGVEIDAIAGLDARGFIFGTAIAARLNKAFVMIRKPSKLPNTISIDYKLEYGTNTVEIQKGIIKPGQKVLIVDDLLATGGTALAAAALIEKVEGTVAGVSCFIELDGLEGRKLIEAKKYKVFTLLKFAASDSSVQEVPKVTAYKTTVGRPNDSRSVVFYHSSMEGIARSMCNMYGEGFRLGHIDWQFFPDGYPNIAFEEMAGIENKDVIYFCNLYDKRTLLEQLSIMMIFPRQFVKSFQIVIPYFAPATMERVDAEGLLATAETAAKIIGCCIPSTRSGPAVIRIFDIHALPVRFYFPDTVIMKMMSAIPLLIQKMDKNMTIAFPDEGASKRFKKVFEDFPQIVCSKVRDGANRSIKIVDRFNWPTVNEDSAMENILIVDDLCHTGGTLDECRKALVKFGAKKVSAYVTHAVFDNDCFTRFLKGGDREGFYKFYCTNTVPEVANKIAGKGPFEVINVEQCLGADILKFLGKPVQSKPSAQIKVYVASTKASKLDAARQAFESIYNKNVVDVYGLEAKSDVNEQPVGEETVKGALNRLENLKKGVALNKIDVDGENVFLVSFESGMYEADKKWTDKTSVQLYHGKKTVSALSEGTACPEGFMEKVLAAKCTITAGGLIEAAYGYKKDSWHKHLGNADRVILMRDALLTILK